MRRRTAALVVAVPLLALALLGVTALADLRSPEGTAELGASLAADADVQALLVDAVVDAIVEDVAQRSRTVAPAVAPIVALARPLLVLAAETTIASPAGQAAVATALTDALRQLSTPGPLVIDLRTAALAAAGEAPEPLDALARSAVEQGVVGLIVLGDAADVDPATWTAPDPTSAGRVAGLPGGAAMALVALLLALAIVAVLVPSAARRRSTVLGAGAALAGVGAVGVLLLRAAPDAIVARIASDPGVSGSPLAAVLPVLVDGVTALLARTGAVGTGLVVLGAALLVVGLRPAPVTAAGSPP